MAQSILLKRSSVAGNVPDSSDLSLGEVAINTADGAVYIKKGNNDIVAVHDNDILHIDTTNSRIGIGTTSPSHSLDVHSGTNDWPIRGISTDAKAGIVLADNNTVNYIMSQSYTLSMGNQPSLHANNLNIKSTGTVGIGTTSPSKRLHVKDSAAHQLQLQGNNSYWNIGTGWSGYYQDYFLLANSSGEKLVIDTNGNVGIGTNGPGQKLDVRNGTITSRDATNTNYAELDRFVGLTLKGNGAGTRTVKTPNTDALTFGTNNTERIRITSSGNLKFTSQTTNFESPGFTYHTNNYLYLRGGSAGLILADDSNANTIQIIDGSSGYINFETGDGTSKMRILANGNVGIRNTSPSATLEVGTLTSGSTGNVIINSEGGNPPGLQVKSRTNRARINVADNDTSGYIIAEGSVFSLGFADGLSANNLNIKNTHDVGIGTTSPVAKLHVQENTSVTYDATAYQHDLFLEKRNTGGANQTTGLRFAVTGYDGSTTAEASIGILQTSNAHSGNLVFGTRHSGTRAERMRITSDGNVGIGTTSPAAPLHITKSSNDVTLLHLSHSSANSGTADYAHYGEILIQGSTHCKSGIRAYSNGYQTANSALAFFTNQHGGSYAERMRITGDGSVGIGTSSPTGAKLHVAGGVKATDLIAHDSTGINLQTDEGTKRLVVADNGVITFNQAYSFPTSDGSANQVLKTDGSGNLTFATVAGASGGTSISDSDGDTKIQVEESSDEDQIRFDAAGTERMRIGSDVQIIGTTDFNITGSNRRLSFTVGTGTIRTTTANSLILATNSTTALTIDSSQNATFAGSVKPYFLELEDINGSVNSLFRVYGWDNELQFTKRNLSTGAHTGTLLALNYSDNSATFLGEIHAKDSNSSADPTITFTGHTDTGLAVTEISGHDHLYFTTAGTARAYVNNSGLFSQTNVYSGNTAAFRNYGGTWAGTTGVAGNGFYFLNTANSNTTKAMELSHDGNVVFAGEVEGASLDINGNADISGNLVLGGNLTVQGTTTTLNTATLDVEDKNITLNYGSGDTSGSANGAGITIQDAINSSTDASMAWNTTYNQFDFSHKINISGNLQSWNVYSQDFYVLNSAGSGWHKWGERSDDRINLSVHDVSANGSITVTGTNANLTLGTSGNNITFGRNGDNYIDAQTGTSSNIVINPQNRFVVNTADTERLRINTAGNVGIGTSSPSEKLHIASGAADHLTLKLEQDNASYESWFEANSQDGGYFRAGISTNSSNYAFFNTDQASYRWFGAGGGSPSMTLTGGNLGIGTTSPAQKLHVAGNAEINGSVHLDGGTTGSGGISYGTGTSQPSVWFWGEDHASYPGQVHIVGRSDNSASNSGEISFWDYTGSTWNQNMVIKKTGRVGIGIASPGQQLDVGGIIRSNATNPQVRIHTSSGTGTGYLVYGDSSDDDIGQIYYSHANNEMGFVVNAGTKMMVKSTGYVGIGTTSPAEKLEVQGNIRAERFIADGSGAMFRKQVDGWSSGAQTHDILYNGWTSSTGDYTYLKSAGNGTSQHGIIQVGDLGTWIGQTNLEQGALADSSTDPIDNVYAFFKSDTSYIKGRLGIGTNAPNNTCSLEIYKNGADSVLRIHDDAGTHAARLHLRSGGNDARIQLPNTSNGLEFRTEQNLASGSAALTLQTNGRADFGYAVRIEEYQIDTTSTSSSATTQIAIHSFAAATFRSARFTVQVTNSTDSTYHTTELLLVHDGTTANITEFGEIHTGSAREATFDADINSGNVRLLATPASTDTMAFKVVCHSITT